MKDSQIDVSTCPHTCNFFYLGFLFYLLYIYNKIFHPIEFLSCSIRSSEGCHIIILHFLLRLR